MIDTIINSPNVRNSTSSTFLQSEKKYLFLNKVIETNSSPKIFPVIDFHNRTKSLNENKKFQNMWDEAIKTTKLKLRDCNKENTYQNLHPVIRETNIKIEALQRLLGKSDHCFENTYVKNEKNVKKTAKDNTPQKITTLIDRCKNLLGKMTQNSQYITTLDERVRVTLDKADLNHTLINLKNTEFPPTVFYTKPELSDSEKHNIIINFQLAKEIKRIKGSKIPLRVTSIHKASNTSLMIEPQNKNLALKNSKPDTHIIKTKKINGRNIELYTAEGAVKSKNHPRDNLNTGVEKPALKNTKTKNTFKSVPSVSG
ncbi:hypothetical protein GKR50_03220 [Providencia rustigianii]|uniref:hypothetical protein n=1 Tax=Providencia rustigianii TaxID=158850 RepID=UPI000F6BF34F|nr:hypothetical protein [Providencia rustigianii]MTC59026.1 hypothetical protein [Providencia rustigianii]VEH53425.1 Uncharacterised protein [Providencia rustigianii]